MEYLTSVLSSKVYDVAIESPLQLATKLSDRLGVNLWIKREDLQPVIDDDAHPSFAYPATFFWLACVRGRGYLRTFIPKNSTISWRCWGLDVSAATCVCGIDLHSPVTLFSVICWVFGGLPWYCRVMLLTGFQRDAWIRRITAIGTRTFPLFLHFGFDTFLSRFLQGE